MAVIQRGPDRGPIYLYDLGPLLAQDSVIQGQNPPRDLLYVIEFSFKVSFACFYHDNSTFFNWKSACRFVNAVSIPLL